MNKHLLLAAAGMLLASALPVDAATPARKTLIAAVDPTGNLYAGGDAAAAYHAVTGYYALYFPLSKHPFCAATATLFTGQGPLIVSTSVEATQLYDVVLVQIVDTTGANKDAAMYVSITC